MWPATVRQQQLTELSASRSFHTAERSLRPATWRRRRPLLTHTPPQCSAARSCHTLPCEYAPLWLANIAAPVCAHMRAHVRMRACVCHSATYLLYCMHRTARVALRAFRAFRACMCVCVCVAYKAIDALLGARSTEGMADREEHRLRNITYALATLAQSRAHVGTHGSEEKRRLANGLRRVHRHLATATK